MTQGTDSTQLLLACDTLIDRIFLSVPRHVGSIGVTAPHQGAGVSTVLRMLDQRIRQRGLGSVACVEPGSSSSDSNVATPLFHKQSESQPRGMHEVAEIDHLKREYDFVLVDLPSIKSAHHAVALAPQLDGMLLVVQANKTQKRQIEYTERVLRAAGGHILGHVLNKREYVIPEWLFRRMEAFGL